MAELDPEIIKAVDDYFDQIKEKVIQRLHKGEEHYHGSWKTLPLGEIRKERDDELLDFFVYSAFLARRSEGPWLV